MTTRRAVLAGLGALGCGGFSANKPYLRSDVQRGIAYANLHGNGIGYGSERSRTELVRLKSLGVTHVALTSFAYLPALDLPELRWGGDPTLSDDGLRKEGAALRELGMAPVFKPHLWSRGFSDGKYAADVCMADDAGWKSFFAQYGDYVLSQAVVAEQTGAAWLCLGSELATASSKCPGAFAALAARVRQIYRGKLTYAAHWDREPDTFPDWDALDYIGINAYFPLGANAEPSVGELVAAWQPHLDRLARLSERHGKPVIFTEAGYPAVRGGTTTPWGAEGASDPALQARAYEALLEACSARDWWNGVYWWKWFTGGAVNEYDESPFSPEGLPAEDVIRRWYSPA
jgi:hypothetical protein